MNWNENLQRLLLLIIAAALAVSILLPLGALFERAFMNEEGEWIGVSNVFTYLASPALAQSLANTMFVSVISTIISVALAFAYAFGIVRTMMRGKTFFRYAALLPLFAPSMMHGLALTFMFGNQGYVTTGFFGLLPTGWDIHLYGPVGIIISEVVFTFPQAFLIMVVALSMSDFRLYEAAETLGAGQMRKFFTVTLPGVKYGLISAFFVCFTLVFTDFGAPKIVGGQYNVLATDMYKYVIGQQNMSMGATVGLVLILPAILAFAVDRYLERKQKSVVSAKAVPFQLKRRPGRDRLYTIYCSVIAGAILILLLTVVYGSFVKLWPYNLSLTLDHFDFTKVAGGTGLEPFWNSLKVSFLTAIIGTIVTYLSAYAIEKLKVWKPLRLLGYFLSIIPLALPGLVLGLSYIFFFNQKSNPLNGLYGTIWILVLVNIVHFFSVAFITATTALKKLDNEYEYASDSMGVPFYRTLFKVTVPITIPAILEMGIYFFINSMVTISAVVFLYAPDLKLASVMIVNMDDAGDIAPASAMSILIVGTSILVRIAYEWGTAKLRRRSAKWQSRSQDM
ncbi:putative 2-aminoethylphosphonate ABC transporter permease subunit [Paenibacillus selenitireducens]|uniref:putative 2-aminoethylphosphonate ABC transporter permease subunit n=1 Tax=Paenibacillus selenitireducens TaxID=1324314 RepID=UPI0009988369|nr:putative 2-aminoethylphosphonate ABC transporter permease subunit [Paenibacillus selenitireducens]